MTTTDKIATHYRETCEVTGAGCDPSYAWSAPRLAKMLDEIREALGAPIDATHAEVLARIGLLSSEPRVWLEGDEIPADTYVLDCWGEVTVEGHALTVWVHIPGKAYVEVPVPDFAAAVAAEKARRAGATE